MKFSHIVAAAGLVVTGLAAAAPAEAQAVVTTTRTTTVHRETGVRAPVVVVHHDRRKVCRTRWSNHHRVRRCTWR